MFTVDNHVKVIARVQVFTLYKVCLIVNEHKFQYFSFQLYFSILKVYNWSLFF